MSSPSQDLQTAQILTAVGYLEACVMPWLMLAAFTVAGMCSIQSNPFALACKPDMTYVVAATMVFLWCSGCGVVFVAKRNYLKATGGQATSSSGPRTKF